MIDHYVGQLVVLKTKWNLKSNRVGLVIGHDASKENILMVLWTDIDGVKIRYHIPDAVLEVNENTIKKIEERICSIK